MKKNLLIVASFIVLLSSSLISINEPVHPSEDEIPEITSINQMG